MSNEKHNHGIEEIDCLEAIDNLYAYLDGELRDQEVLGKFEAHLEHCRSCYSRSEMEKELNRRIRKSASNEVPETLQLRIRGLLDKL